MLKAGEQLLLVGRSRGGEHDRIDIRIGDGVERVDDGAAAGDGGGDLLGLLGDVVVDDNHPGAGDSGAQSGDVIGAHHADTQNGYTQVGH